MDYSRFLTDVFRVYGGAVAQNPHEGRWGDVYEGDLAGRVGFRYLLPFLVELDVSLDHKKRLEVELEYELFAFIPSGAFYGHKLGGKLFRKNRSG